MSRDGSAHEDGRAARDDIAAAVRVVADRGRVLAGAGAQVVGSGLDDAVRLLVSRRVERATRPEATPVSTEALIEALGTKGSSSMSPWVGAGAARLARTGRAAKALGGRTPLGLAVRFGPALYTAISANLRGLDAAIARLVTRAREAGVEPDPGRLHRVVVQALAGDPVAADTDPDEIDHAALVRIWLGDAGRRALPFGLDRLAGFRGGRTPEAVAALLDTVDVRLLARR